jgi:HprK-related kinase A
LRVGELDERSLRERLRAEGLALDFGAARARLFTDVPGLCSSLRRVYAHFPIEPPGGLFTVTARLRHARGLRRFVRPQVELEIDGRVPFEPFPAHNHLPLLEWGLNWYLAERCNTHLLLHAGVVERGGAGVILPAQPGSGKSTLTAALVASGFRLLSDEFGAARLGDGRCVPMLRPISLKNESIGIIARLRPGAPLGPTFAGTRRGNVAHLGPDAASVEQRRLPATIRLIVFPRFEAGAGMTLEPMPRARAFAKLSVNSFNYEVLGPAGFDAVGRLIEGADCYQLVYGDLADAVPAIGRLLGH